MSFDIFLMIFYLKVLMPEMNRVWIAASEEDGHYHRRLLRPHGSSWIIMDHHGSPGWWFGTFFICPYIGNYHPNGLIFCRGVAQPPTSHHGCIFQLTAPGISTVEVWDLPPPENWPRAESGRKSQGWLMGIDSPMGISLSS